MPVVSVPRATESAAIVVKPFAAIVTSPERVTYVGTPVAFATTTCPDVPLANLERAIAAALFISALTITLLVIAATPLESIVTVPFPPVNAIASPVFQIGRAHV